jgi:hypothetical protein
MGFMQKIWKRCVLVHGLRGFSLAICGSTFLLTPIVAQTTLTLEAINAITSAVTTAISASLGKPALLESAIAQVLVESIAKYGTSSAGQLSSVVLATAEKANVPAGVIGRAMARAAMKEADLCVARSNVALDAKKITSCAAANGIAKAIADSGTAEEVAAFQALVNSQGYTELATLAGSSAEPVGAIGGGTPSFSGGTSGGPAPSSGCLNPSCTSL